MHRSSAYVPLCAFAAVAAMAPAPAAAADELALKLSRSLETPTPAAAAPSTPPRPGASPATPIMLDTHPKGALFLRADRLEGDRSEMTAEGSVELRARDQTVLADWLNYNAERDEIFARGHVVLRQGFDWITGPELKFKRDAETGYFTAPRFNVTEVNAKGSASEIRFKGPQQYEASDAT